MSVQLNLFPDFLPTIIHFLEKDETEKVLSEEEKLELDYKSYPSSDDEPMAQDTRQAEIMMILKNALSFIFQNKRTTFVGIDLFLYKSRFYVKAPDLLVAHNVKAIKHRKSFIIDKEGKAPDVVIEVMSHANYKDKNDLPRRFKFYLDCGIKEFWIIHTEPEIRIEIYLLTSPNYYQKILDFPKFYDDYLEATIYVENQEIMIEDKDGKDILRFNEQALARLEAEKEKERAEKEKKEAEKEKKEAEKEKKEAQKAEKLEREARKKAEKEKKEAELALQQNIFSKYEIEMKAKILAEENLKLNKELEMLKELLAKQMEK